MYLKFYFYGNREKCLHLIEATERETKWLNKTNYYVACSNREKYLDLIMLLLFDSVELIISA